MPEEKIRIHEAQCFSLKETQEGNTCPLFYDGRYLCETFEIQKIQGQLDIWRRECKNECKKCNLNGKEVLAGALEPLAKIEIIRKEKFEIQEKNGERFILVDNRCIGTDEDIIDIYLEAAKNDPLFMLEENGTRTRMMKILERKVEPTRDEIKSILEHEGIFS